MRNSSGRRTICVGALAIAIASCLYSSAAGAQDERAESGPIDLHDALARAIAHNKELAAFEHRLEEQAGRLQQAGIAPNPELGLTVEDVAGSDAFSGVDSAQTTLSLGWVLERGVRSRRVGAEQARSALRVYEADVLRLDVAAETARRFLESLASQARLEHAREAVTIAEQTVGAVKQRVRAGRAPTAERTRAEAELSMSRLARDDVQHELAAAHQRLAAQWGEIEPRFSEVSGELLSLPETESFDALTARIEQNPQLVRLASEARLAEANLRLAEARRRPSMRPSVGVRRFEARDDWAFVAEFRFPLPVLDRNQGGIAASRAALARTHADTDAIRVRVRTQLFEIYQELQHELHRSSILRDEVVPRLAQALRETRRSYERGRYSYLEWRSVQADLLEARRELVEASAGAHRRVIALEQLTGQRVAHSGGRR